MGNVVVWALLTGGVTGAAWVGIVLLGRRWRGEAQRDALLEDVHERVGELAHVDRRLAEVEERLDFAERRLARRPSEP